ncbi:MAG: SIS domain-containing protein [Candidatus Eisenbacteria bacterium]|nr:SIS domain-containing protein [Candidatus Eisenbacteria bacterium]
MSIELERIEAILTECARSMANAPRAAPDVQRAADAVVAALRGGGRALLCGNGGSASDAQHIAAELVGRLGRERPGMAAEALTVNPSTLTALSNDYGYERVFARQVEAVGRPGDVLIGLSTSGGSLNVVEALHAARDRGLTTVALTGERGGPVAEAADIAVRAPATRTQRVQELHIAIGHALCEVVEDELHPAEGA